ncbi:hypothetical protein M3201_18550 [Paenibacillus motobuensis]|uniref:hypothetical protein n=1 Tax=Paenibacillus TaxID=44249 RepID=UPI00203A4F81|nr:MULTISPECIES: hypothetical protein [Paenibacillus]MCM3041698.1 hypothetical protein [Paenibacillus lutimineralis]MCM3648802.1 hypothetical protein [Paenibacillus motobuensis]
MEKQEIAKIAAETALVFYKKEQERQNTIKRDRRLRNTKLLLRNYRKFKIHCAENTQELEELRDPDSFKYLDVDDLAIESIIKNKERTAVMLNYLDNMLEIYRILSEKSKKPEDLRRYEIMYDFYIAEDEKTADELSECHKIHKRSIYRDINKACEVLSSLIFGVDGLRLIS